MIRRDNLDSVNVLGRVNVLGLYVDIETDVHLDTIVCSCSAHDTLRDTALDLYYGHIGGSYLCVHCV